MKKLMLTFLVVVLLIASSVSAVSAKPDNPNRPEKLDQVIFVHPVAPEKPGKPDKPPGKPPKDEEPKDNDYYELWGGYLADTLTFKINPTVSLVTGGDPVAAIKAAAESWDGVTPGIDLFQFSEETTDKDWYALDEENTISWVRFLPRNTIAVAVMWYDPETMIIYEVDIVFNALHNWGINPAKKDRAYDVQNIATHEFGHPTGLEDLYSEIYSELTMFGYSSKGETKKITLENGDIAGAQYLYEP